MSAPLGDLAYDDAESYRNIPRLLDAGNDLNDFDDDGGRTTVRKLVATLAARDVEIARLRSVSDAAVANLEAVAARVTQLEAALRGHFKAFDDYGFNCGNDESYLTTMVDDLREAVFPTGTAALEAK